MLQFLSTYWFFALSSLLVPVLIHWWNKRPPQVVRVGSIRWLQAAASRQARARHLADWPLLLLRCLLLAALVGFLCQPLWQQRQQAGRQKLVLVAPALLQGAALARVQNALDSLLQQNYALHRFEPGFPPISAEEWAGLKSGEQQLARPRPQTGYWALAGSLAAAFPKAKEQVVFTPGQLRYFTGARPALPAPTRWVTIPLEQEHTWVQEAFFTGPDSLLVVLGSSAAAGTAYRQYRLPVPAAGQVLQTADSPRLVFSRQDAAAYLATENQSPAVPVRQSPWIIAIVYDPARRQDARYLRAALAALATYTGLPLTISPAPVPAQLDPASNWIFWLSDAPLPAGLPAQLARGRFLFRDAPTGGKPLPAGTFAPAGLPGLVTLFRQTALPAGPLISPWQNQFGEPLLHFQPSGQGGVYTFASRFHPQWSELTASSFFPELLAGLLLPAPAARYDARLIDPEQAAPTVAATARQAPMPDSPTFVNLKYWFIGLAAALFLWERLWSFRKGKLA